MFQNVGFIIIDVPWRRTWQPTQVFLTGEFHEQRNLVSYSPGGCKESDRTDGLSLHTVRPTDREMTFFEKIVCFSSSKGVGRQGHAGPHEEAGLIRKQKE